MRKNLHFLLAPNTPFEPWFFYKLGSRGNSRAVRFATARSQNGVSKMRYNLLTKREAARAARICVRQLELLVKAGRGPTVTRLGGKFLVRSDHLEKWVESMAQPSIDGADKTAA